MTVGIECPGLPNPPNGETTYSSDTSAPFDFGTAATYICDTGFGLSGDSMRMCRGNGSSTTGEWSGVAPSCQGKLFYS